MNTWKNIGKGFAYAAKGAVIAAKYSSDHPEVIQIISTVTGHPEVGVVVNTVHTTVTDIQDARKLKDHGEQ